MHCKKIKSEDTRYLRIRPTINYISFLRKEALEAISGDPYFEIQHGNSRFLYAANKHLFFGIVLLLSKWFCGNRIAAARLFFGTSGEKV